MPNQAILAKTCVFLLLGLNIAAYYFFWPKQATNANLEMDPVNAPRCEPAAPTVTAPQVPRPREFAEPTPAPIQVAGADKVEKEGPLASDDLVQKLLAHMKQEDQAAMTKAPVDPRRLPSLQAEPLPRDPNQLDPSKIGVTSPLTARSLPSIWTIRREAVGQQTLLIVELHGAPRGFAEFRILCDRVETTAGKDVLALGNVVFTGANLRGDCHRLTLPTREGKLILEGQVRVVQDPALGTLTGERIVWDAPSAFPMVDRSHANPAVLGAPK